MMVHFTTFATAYAIVAVNVFAATPWGPGVVAAFAGTQTVLFAIDGKWSEIMSAAILAGAFVALVLPESIVVFSIASVLFGVYLIALGATWAAKDRG